MRLFQITKPGLIAIAVCVAFLWGCIGAEKLIRRRAESAIKPVRLERHIPRHHGIFTFTYLRSAWFPFILEA